MLYFVTGDIQIGKTRWLMSLIEEMRAKGIIAEGVIAPGVWIESHEDGQTFYEKTGIDNVFLPSGERVHLATRYDLCDEEKKRDMSLQSNKAKIYWVMDDAVMERANAYFAELAALAEMPLCGEDARVLVVDELGVLELLRGGGLSNAVALLKKGSCPRYRDALVIVRSNFLAYAHALFDEPWAGNVREIHHGDNLTL